MHLSFLFAFLLSTTTVAIIADEAEDPRRDRGGECPSTSEERGGGGGGNYHGGCDAPSGPMTTPPSSSSSVYVIGDIHGDAICAVSWVNRTGLVGNLFLDESPSSSSSSSPSVPLYQKLNDPTMWTWTDVSSTLVFMGDYVDKGPTAKQTVEFVRHLTIHFPNNVHAILGNHELELLRDRDDRISPVDRYSAYSYATVHPGDYHNYITGGGDVVGVVDDDETADGSDDPSSTTTTTSSHSSSSSGGGSRALDDKDDLVLDLLYEANMEVYAHRAHSAVRVVPSLPPHIANHDRIRYAITDIMPPEHRPLARERLAEYQAAYLDAYRSGTKLGSWLEKRPIVHLAVGGVNTLFVPGGVSDRIGRAHFSNGTAGVDAINSAWRDNSNEGRLYDFLRGTSKNADDDDDDVHMGNVVYELLTYRGNHPGYKNWESHGTYEEDSNDDDDVCNALYDMLETMDSIDRIAVGHTPEDEIRIMCDGKFLALDSTLGRWIRGTGNEYCPGPEYFDNRRDDIPRTSRNGKYTCDEVKEICEGQIVRLDSDGSVNILTM